MSDLASKYLILKPLGKQVKRKFGKVYLVENKKTKEHFVMKANTKTSQNQLEIEQLKKEIQYSFDIKGLPKVIDVYESESELILVKSYQKGIQLDDFWGKLKKKQRIPFLIMLSEKLAILLDAIHSDQIYHCDLKPANIIIDGDYENFNVELVDFGLAINQTKPDYRKLIFPLGFAAPELILNKLDLVNQTTDYFSIGIIYWKLLAGELPLINPNPSIYTNLQLVHPLPEHGKIPSNLLELLNKLSAKPFFKTSPNRLNEVDVKKEIHQSQQQRYQDFNEFVNELEALQLMKQKRWLF